MAHRSQSSGGALLTKWNREATLQFPLKTANLNSYAVGIRKVALNAAPMGPRDLRRRPSPPL